MALDPRLKNILISDRFFEILGIRDMVFTLSNATFLEIYIE